MGPSYPSALTRHVAIKEHTAKLGKHAALHPTCTEAHTCRSLRHGLRCSLRVGATPRERERECGELTPLRCAQVHHLLAREIIPSRLPLSVYSRTWLPGCLPMSACLFACLSVCPLQLTWP